MALSALLAGLTWAVVWWHGTLAHGVTAVNEMQLVLGLTWMDSAKFLAPAVALLVPGFALLTCQALAMAGRPAAVSGFVSTVALTTVAVGAAMQTWPFPWGSYEEQFETMGGGVVIGGVVQGIGSLLLAVATCVLSVGLARAGAAPLWLAMVLTVGALFTFFLTPASPLPAIAWLALGGWMLATNRFALTRGATPTDQT